MKQELIPLTSPSRWRAALENLNHAFGHTWENCYALQLSSGVPTYLYCLEADGIKVVCPLTERMYKGYIDIVTPYGFSGFVGSRDLPDFQHHWKSFVQNHGYVCGYIGLNPLLVNNTYLDLKDLFAYNTLYVLDLRLSINAILDQMAYNRRHQLKNYESQVNQFTMEKDLLKDFFITHYHAFFTQKKASSAYNLSPETLLYLLDLDNVVLIGKWEEGKISAVSVLAYTAFGAEYLFNVSVPEGRHQAALLLWHGIQYLKSINIPYLNLGGGVTEGDSIAQFKQRFGAQEYRLICLKQVYNQQVYRLLCREANADPENKEGYFPAYRKP